SSVPRPPSTSCCCPRPSRPCSTSRGRSCAAPSSSTTPRTPISGAATSSTRDPPPSTEAPRRSSATSSPPECWDCPVPDDLSKDIRSAVTPAAKASPYFSYSRLVELGWDDLLAEEPRIAVAALFEEMGRLLLTGAALDAVVLLALGGQRSAAQTRVASPG